MNDQNNRRAPARPDGGTDRRNVQREKERGVRSQQRQGAPQRRPDNRINSEQMIREARMYAGVSPGYTQMPLRPMTSMPRDRVADRSQQPPRQTQRPQRPAPAPRQPQMQRPQRQAQGQRPAPAAQQAQRPQRPPQGAQQNKRPMQPPVRERMQRGGAPVPTQNGRRRPSPERNQGVKRPQTQNQWVVPEGSAVYTAEGRMYDARRGGQGPARRPNGQKRGAPQRGPQNRRPEQKKKRFNKEKFFHGVKTFFIRLLTMLLVVSLLGFWWYRSEFYSHSRSRSGSVSCYMKDAGSYEVKASVAYRNDVLYVDFTEISNWFGMVSVGSVNSMRFICTEDVSETSSGKGGEEYAIFTSGSATVLVNGTSISLEEACRTVDSHIWVPLSFVEGYVSGIVCEKNASGDKVTFALEGEGEESENKKTDENEEKAEIGFKVKAQNAIAPVEYPA